MSDFFWNIVPNIHALTVASVDTHKRKADNFSGSPGLHEAT